MMLQSGKRETLELHFRISECDNGALRRRARLNRSELRGVRRQRATQHDTARPDPIEVCPLLAD